MDELDLRATPQRGEEAPQPIVRRLSREELVDEPDRLGHVHPGRRFPEQTLSLHFERTQGFLQRRLERPVDGHDLAGRLHLRAERAIRRGELVEGPPRDLHDDVVERGLEGSGRLLRDRVRYLVKPLADRDLGGDARDRVARRFGRERRASRDARVHLDHEVRHLCLGITGGAAIGVQGELDVAAALDPERADDAQRGRAEHLVLLVGERLRRRDDDGVAGMHAHRVDVLHVADGDAGVTAVAHHLVLDLFPTEEGALDKHLADRRRCHTARHTCGELCGVVGYPTARAAEREGRPDDEWVAHARRERERVLDRMRRDRFGNGLADREEKLLERLAVLGLLDRRKRRAQKANSKAFERPGLRELHREVQAGLPAQRREESARPLLLDDPLEYVDGERFDIRDVGDTGVGHDRRGIRVHENGLDAFLAQRAARLRPRVVELGRLADQDRPAPDDQDFHRSRAKG